MTSLAIDSILSDSSIIERQKIFQIGLREVMKHFWWFRLPDSTADLNLGEVYLPGSNVIIDNVHNFYLELGLHIGWIIALVTLVSVMSFAQKTTRMFMLSEDDRNDIDILLIWMFMAYAGLMFTILSPITILVLGFILGNILVRYKNEKMELVCTRKSKRTLSKESGQEFNFKRSKYFKGFIGVFCVANAIYLSVSIFQRVQFHNLESDLISRNVNFLDGVANLNNLAIAMGDRGFLDYSGRQIAIVINESFQPPLSFEFSRRSKEVRLMCNLLDQNIERQTSLSFLDLNFKFLSIWYGQHCSEN
jgi:hypothetical protein